MRVIRKLESFIEDHGIPIILHLGSRLGFTAKDLKI